MRNTPCGAAGAAALAALVAALCLAGAPLRAQQASPTPAAPGSDAGAGAAAPEAAAQRAGAALRDMSAIQARYNQRMQGAQPAEHAAIEQEANSAAEAALAARGLTLEEYNGVIRLAQADPALRERLVAGAAGGR